MKEHLEELETLVTTKFQNIMINGEFKGVFIDKENFLTLLDLVSKAIDENY